MLPAIRDLNVPVVLVNVQKKKKHRTMPIQIQPPGWANYTPAALLVKWLQTWACRKETAVITGVVEGGDPAGGKEGIAEWCTAAQVRRNFVIPISPRLVVRIRA